MLSRLPLAIPAASVLLADLGHPSTPDLAAALGVSVRTVWRWRESDAWPRAARLSLFFASSWGWSAVECDARRSVEVWRQLADAQGRELRELRQLVRHLASLDHGSANQPTMRA